MNPFIVMAGIGKVTLKKGESRQQAERRGRREHGRRSLRKAVVLPGIGRVKPRARESFAQAVKRAKAAHAEKSRNGRGLIVEGGAPARPKKRRNGRGLIVEGGAPARPKKRRERVVLFGPKEGDESVPSQELIQTLRKFPPSIKARRISLTVSGVIQRSPSFTVLDPFRVTRSVIDPGGAGEGTIGEIIRELMTGASPDLVIIESVSYVSR